MKVIYDRRSGKDRRAIKDSDKASLPISDQGGKKITEERRMFGDRRKHEGLELSIDDLAADEFTEVFKQFQQDDTEEINGVTKAVDQLEIINYQVLYRKNVECAYITILHIEQEETSEPILYAFREEELNGGSVNESKPTHVQNIFGADAYQCYIEQGWEDISKSENEFPWTIKAWLAQNMKPDTLETRKKLK